MTTITVTIFGLGRIGASIGLALKRHSADKKNKQTFQITGADNRPAMQDAARQRGALDSLARSFPDAAANRDIIVLALPYSEVQATYRVIASELRPGAVVLDMSPLTLPSLEWAAKYLPPTVHMVSMTPMVNFKYLFDGLDDAEHAAADLFDMGEMLVMPSPNCAKEAVELAADFASVLGAKPHFMDAAEHDGLAALTEGLPALLGVLAFTLMQGSQSRDDAQRMTNNAFGQLTHHLHDSHPDDMRDLLLHNRQQMLHAIDQTSELLSLFRDMLTQNNRAALEGALIHAAESYAAWAAHRRTGQWDDAPTQPGYAPSILTGLIGGHMAKRLRGDKDDEKS